MTVAIYVSVVKVHNFCYIFLNILSVSYVHKVRFYSFSKYFQYLQLFQCTTGN